MRIVGNPTKHEIQHLQANELLRYTLFCAGAREEKANITATKALHWCLEEIGKRLRPEQVQFTASIIADIMEDY